jgi:predicted nucleic acid-binding protein
MASVIHGLGSTVLEIVRFNGSSSNIQDSKIASIALTHQSTGLTQNQGELEQIAGLSIEY